jgi:hypothetical protein
VDSPEDRDFAGEDLLGEFSRAAAVRTRIGEDISKAIDASMVSVEAVLGRWAKDDATV